MIPYEGAHGEKERDIVRDEQLTRRYVRGTSRAASRYREKHYREEG
jgi:hypothetical protein